MSNPIFTQYMEGVKNRARMLARACSLRRHEEQEPNDPQIDLPFPGLEK